MGAGLRATDLHESHAKQRLCYNAAGCAAVRAAYVNAMSNGGYVETQPVAQPYRPPIYINRFQMAVIRLGGLAAAPMKKTVTDSESFYMAA